ncbi:hypothetical protein NP233_g1735 [Leucocoprinus birnbaumii]|uniref:Uncharacterized protein n=1 Tax=Leucocoprinus birnbaumii TaxID=56174 RepID=A0AAD5VZG6_9AGAR|nr:hypothetical protein NP233_g1735 [Leucocoprinus birnbaumii]
MQHPAVITKAKAAAVAQVASKHGNKNASSGGTLTVREETGSWRLSSVRETLPVTRHRRLQRSLANQKLAQLPTGRPVAFQVMAKTSVPAIAVTNSIEGEDAFVEGGLIDQELENGEEVAEGKEVVGQVKEQLYYADARSSKQRVTSGRPKVYSLAKVKTTTSIIPPKTSSAVATERFKRDDPRFTDLPLQVQQTWSTTYQARLHLLLGTLETWESPDDGHIAQSDDLLPTWRRNFGKTAPNILQGTVVPNGLGDNNNTEKRAERCKWALSREEGCQPLLFAKISEDEEGVQKRTGLFQSTIIIGTALATHMSRISSLPESGRGVTYPSGALFLSIQAARHAIKLHRSRERME